MSRQSSVLAARGRGLLALALALPPACAPLGPPPPTFASPSRLLRRCDSPTPSGFRRTGLSQPRRKRRGLGVRGEPAPRSPGSRPGGRAPRRRGNRHPRRRPRGSPRRARRRAGPRRRLGRCRDRRGSCRRDRAGRPDLGGRSLDPRRGRRVTATSLEVILPGCPDWSRDPGFDPRNLPLSNLGWRQRLQPRSDGRPTCGPRAAPRWLPRTGPARPKRCSATAPTR